MGSADCLAQNRLGVTDSLYRVEAPYGWEGGNREARGSGGRGVLRGELPWSGDSEVIPLLFNRQSATHKAPGLLIGKPGRLKSRGRSSR